MAMSSHKKYIQELILRALPGTGNRCLSTTVQPARSQLVYAVALQEAAGHRGNGSACLLPTQGTKGGDRPLKGGITVPSLPCPSGFLNAQK